MRLTIGFAMARQIIKVARTERDYDLQERMVQE